MSDLDLEFEDGFDEVEDLELDDLDDEDDFVDLAPLYVQDEGNVGLVAV